MTGFHLSPGITPLLVDVFVIEFPIALGLGWVFRRESGFLAALGVNAALFGGIKFATDYSDLADIPVALAALSGGLWLLATTVGPRVWPDGRTKAAFVGGVLLVLIGVVKIARDFWDPFDLMLSDTNVVIGVLLVAGRGSRRTVPDAPRPSPG